MRTRRQNLTPKQRAAWDAAESARLWASACADGLAKQMERAYDEKELLAVCVLIETKLKPAFHQLTVAEKMYWDLRKAGNRKPKKKAA